MRVRLILAWFYFFSVFIVMKVMSVRLVWGKI